VTQGEALDEGESRLFVAEEKLNQVEFGVRHGVEADFVAYAEGDSAGFAGVEAEYGHLEKQ
jgi:hypothetical protein